MRNLQIFALVMGLSATAAVSEARQQPSQPPSRATVAAPQPPVPPKGPAQSSPGYLVEQPDAQEVRSRLRDVLNQYPPSVREVLRIDPTLLNRPDYLSTYPVLAAFLDQHPQVAHNPGFFVGEWRAPEENTPAGQAFRELSRMFENLTVVFIIITITIGIVFLIRTAIEHRRWQRTMRAQTELNTKLIDRFSSSEELLAYLQSPAGKALIEPAVVSQAGPRPMQMNAPLSRIFWSLQSGIVVSTLGTGLIFVSRGVATDEFAQVLYGVGIVVLTIGLGFAISAAVSYLLSQRLGLIQSLSARYSGEAPGS
jgi:ABC-type multidrug transport system fused ATPase/permease subunit